jgi:hypothetical protein
MIKNLQTTGYWTSDSGKGRVTQDYSRVIRTHTQEERQGTVINGLDCGFLQLVVVTSEELEYMKVRTHKVGTRASEAA